MTSPKEILQARGIYEASLKLGWTEGANYWEFPLFDLDGNEIARRGKAYPNQNLPKYIWPDGKPKNPASDYYIPKGTIEAIREADGVCFLANGETALAAFHAAGIYNVIATPFSEVTVPKTLIETLEKLGVTLLINIADKDKAGTTAAAKWRDALRDSEYGYQAKQWPDYLAEKSDFNDLWVHLAFDRETTLMALDECQALILPQPEVKRLVAVNQDDKLSEGRKLLIGGIHQELQSRNSFSGKIRRDVWAACTCPFHDDTKGNESAGFNIESGVLNCFVCGSLSPYEVAKRLGLDWKAYYPKPEGKKKPLKPELARFQEVLEETYTSTDNRSYTDVLRDEAQAAVIAYDAKQFVSWWKGKMPQGSLSAVMTLAPGRSSLAVFLGRLDRALHEGKLGTVADVETIASAVQMGRKTVNRSLLEAEHMGFCTLLSGISTKDIDGKETPRNGRPRSFYLFELSIPELQSRLKKMLEIYYTERHNKKAIAMPTIQIASQLGLDETEYRSLWDTAKQALADKANKLAKQALDTEMFGNGGNWKGWHAALESDYAMPLDFFAYEDCQDLRAAIARHWVTHVRAENSREELARLLGCTDPVIDKVFEKANLLSMPQMEKVEFAAPKTVAAMAFEFGKVQRDKKGKCWKVGYWVEGETGWLISDDKNYLDNFANNAGRISKVFMLVNMHSIQRAMTEDEIKARDEKKVAEALKNGAKQGVGAISEDAIAIEKQAALEAPKRAYSYQKWDKHSYAFLYRQLQLLIHCFTAYKLDNHSVVDKQGNAIVAGQLDALSKWFIANKADAPKRKVASFYGKHYDEIADIAALQAIADSRMAALGKSESIQFEDIAEETPITRLMELQFEAPKPSRKLTEVKHVYDTSNEIADLVRIFSGS